jgi:tetratricopeptide (TPR) repeat protein
MGFRFFRRVRIAPGVSLNFSKKGASVSVGHRGAKLTFGSRGIRATAGIPGTGLYYTQTTSSGRRAVSRSRPATNYSLPEAQPHIPTAEEKLTLGFFQKLFTPPEEKLFVEGCKCYVTNDSKQAYYNFKTSLHIADSAFMAGLLSIKEKNYSDAQVCLEKAFSKSQELGKYFNKYGLALDINLPITDEISASIQPNIRGLLLTLAEVYQELKLYPKAGECLKKLRQLEPNDIIIKLSLAELLFYFDKKNVKHLKFIVSLSDGVNNDSAISVALLLYKIKALRQLDLHEAVKEVIAEIGSSKKLPDNLASAIQYEKALMLENIGQIKRANAEFQKIYAKEPKYEDVAKRLGL